MSIIIDICLSANDGPVDPFIVLSRGLEAGAKRKLGTNVIAQGIYDALDALGVQAPNFSLAMSEITTSAERVVGGEDPEAEANSLCDRLEAAGLNMSDPDAYFEPGT
jgi:hypothetical protein